MVKRKAARKKATQGEKKSSAGKGKQGPGGMPVPLLMMKVLAVFLSVILVIALTLYVLGRMPARGFWVLIIILAVIGFGVMPAMRKRFSGET